MARVICGDLQSDVVSKAADLLRANFGEGAESQGENRTTLLFGELGLVYVVAIVEELLDRLVKRGGLLSDNLIFALDDVLFCCLNPEFFQ